MPTRKWGARSSSVAATEESQAPRGASAAIVYLVAVAGSGPTQLAGTRTERNASTSAEQVLLGARGLRIVCRPIAIELVPMNECGSTIGQFAHTLPVSEEIPSVVARDGEQEQPESAPCHGDETSTRGRWTRPLSLVRVSRPGRSAEWAAPCRAGAARPPTRAVSAEPCSMSREDGTDGRALAPLAQRHAKSCLALTPGARQASRPNTSSPEVRTWCSTSFL